MLLPFKTAFLMKLYCRYWPPILLKRSQTINFTTSTDFTKSELLNSPAAFCNSSAVKKLISQLYLAAKIQQASLIFFLNQQMPHQR